MSTRVLLLALATTAQAQEYMQVGLDAAGRQDANMPDYYRKASSDDPPDRRGMGESLHIAGLYKLLDGLLEDNPGLVMDNCAR